MGGKQIMKIGAGKEMKDLRDTHGNRREGTNDDRETTDRQAEGIVNRRETKRCRRKRRDG
jgi:hypothetical protein